MKIKKVFKRNLLCMMVAISLLCNVVIVNAIGINNNTNESNIKVEKSAKEMGAIVHPVDAKWNPLTASDEELAYHFYPARPSDPQKEKEWEATVKDVKWIEPRFTEGERKSITKTEKSKNIFNSAADPNNQWGGVETHQTSQRVTGCWTLPTAYAPYGVEAHSSTWIGIGGDNGSTSLVQAGTESSIDSSNRRIYHLWWEIVGTSLNIPQQNITNLPFQPLDQFYCDITVRPNYPESGFWTASFYIYDMTSRYATSFAYSIYNCNGITNCAEWVTERPLIGGKLAGNLTNFGDVHMWNCGSSPYYNGSVTLINGSSGYIWYEQLKSADLTRDLATTGSIGTQGNYILTWRAYN